MRPVIASRLVKGPRLILNDTAQIGLGSASTLMGRSSCVKFHNRRARPTVKLAGKREGDDRWMRLQERVNRALQIADPFAMDNSHFQDPSLPTSIEVRQNDLLNFARLN